ncbi:Uncharacterised protein [Mycobacteroides abscessus subsp. abscessus]|nr:Uncharacterised protein [Mycobacteroides abscessus subsp. abscessus]
MHRALDEVPQEQGVAARRSPHHVGAEALERAAQHLLHERDALPLRQGIEFEPLQIVVLPQRGHRVRDRLAAANGGDHVPHVIHRDLVQQRRREIVQ